ncbi:hypothetical protein LPB140_08315 [Sphingorhabdus lutea]|uniref:Metallo-beta-lactamase domain-containing protein n=1 Tax=Sphingorhabdus lutea TaxID=1913578 RepID=A0A1L3JCD4_9SPHN|nr:subclass B3 metallo-beta-lactamase [Sphingorhabdus lutea]APG62791.1 hypothetical protein LPB140_08315 [Sphingorhabdus lutea]
MLRSFTYIFISAALCLTGCGVNNNDAPRIKNTQSPQKWAATCKDRDEWDKPAPAFHIYGNSWYVGTCGISAILIDSGNGLILIDSGTEVGADIVMANIISLGFKLKDVKIILSSHEHFDHIGGLAKIKAFTNAQIYASKEAAPVMMTGQSSADDPQHGLHKPMRPVNVDKIVNLEEAIILGNIGISPISTPGHTPGALSWSWQDCENKICKNIIYADSLSPIGRDDYKFSDHPVYLANYRSGMERLAKMQCDILLTPHPSSSNMVKRAASGSFIGAMNCHEYTQAASKRLNDRLASEAK